MLTLYSTTDCSHCRRLRGQLQRERIPFTEVDVEEDAVATEYVMGVNGGHRMVPTVRFADGGVLTNPTIAQVRARLAASAMRPDTSNGTRS